MSEKIDRPSEEDMRRNLADDLDAINRGGIYLVAYDDWHALTGAALRRAQTAEAELAELSAGLEQLPTTEEATRLPSDFFGALPTHHVSTRCKGEACSCGAPASHKVGEEIPHDDPCPTRHNFTAYVCCACFRRLLGPAVMCPKDEA